MCENWMVHSTICRFQNELPKKIEQRGKKAYLEYDELVQAMKWKQTVSNTHTLNTNAHFVWF